MQLNYQQYSDEGEDLVILHGLFGNLKNWNWHARELASEFRVFSLDLRNHGDSPHSDSMGYEEMADDVLDFLDGQALGSAAFVGHSMGGKVAMQLALKHPERVSRLLVADISPVAYGEERGDHENVFAGLLSIDTATLESRSAAENQLAAHVTDRAVRQFLVSNLIRDEKGQFRWRFNLPALHNNYASLRSGVGNHGSYDGPVLFVKGALSNYIREEDWPLIVTLFPNAAIKTIMGAGHWLHAEKPQLFHKLARDFLGSEVKRQ